MDINTTDLTTAAGASAYQQGQTSDRIAAAVAVKALDAQRQAGAGIERMLAAAMTGVGTKVDVTG